MVSLYIRITSSFTSYISDEQAFKNADDYLIVFLQTFQNLILPFLIFKNDQSNLGSNFAAVEAQMKNCELYKEASQFPNRDIIRERQLKLI